MINLLASLSSFFIKDAYCYTQLIVDQVYVPITLLLYSHIPTAIVSLFAGIFLLIKSRKLETKIFFFLTLAFFIFTLGDLTEWFAFFGRSTVMFARSIIELIDPLLFILSSYFLYVLIKKKDINFIYKIIWLLLPLPELIMIIRGINFVNYNWLICEVTENTVLTNYVFYIDIFYVATAILFAIWSIIKAKENRKEITIASIGVCLFIVLFFVMEYVLTGYIFGSAFDYSYFVYAFFSMPILILFLGYLIIKYNEFNVKLISAQALVWALVALIGAEFFFLSGVVSFVLAGVTFLGVVIFGRLLIKSVKREIEQKEHIEKIEKELEKAYAIEKRANEELQKLDAYKNDFLRETQHDLKNPLTVIMGYSDLLLGGTFGKIPIKAIDIIKRMQVVAQNKLKDIVNFLDVEQFRMGKGVVSLKPGIELFPMLEEIVAGLAYNAESKGIYLKLAKQEKSILISADREKLKSALFDIVDNSVKYTEKGGVDIKLEGNGTAKIKISDTGIGIPEDKLKSIFETQFERTKQAQKIAAGTGVGLYLSAQIIKMHNGKVWAESEGEGKGSTFYVELPVAQ